MLLVHMCAHVYTHTWGHSCSSVWVCVWRKEDNIKLSLGTLSTSFETLSFIDLELSSKYRVRWPMNPRDSPVFSSLLGLQPCATLPNFLCSWWSSNSARQALYRLSHPPSFVWVCYCLPVKTGHHLVQAVLKACRWEVEAGFELWTTSIYLLNHKTTDTWLCFSVKVIYLIEKNFPR